MSDLGAESTFLTVPDPSLLGPKPDEVNLRQGTFVDLYATNINGSTVGTLVTTTGAQTMSNKSLVDANTYVVDETDPTKRLSFDVTNATTGTTSVISMANTASRTYTVPDSGANSSFVMTAGTQTIAGAKTFSSTLTAPNITASTINTAVGNLVLNPAGPSVDFSGKTIINAVLGTSPSLPFTGSGAAGTDALIFNRTAEAEPRYLLDVDGEVGRGDGTNPQDVFEYRSAAGTVTYSTSSLGAPNATIAAGNVNLAATTNQLTLGTTNTTTLSATAPAASSVYTIPDVGTSASFVMTAGTQTIAGLKTFSSTVTITPTTNQLTLGTTNTTTINATAPAASRVYTIPDAGGAASFVMTAGTQTIAGSKTFSAAVSVSATTNQLVLGTTNTTTINVAAPVASRVYTVPDSGANSSFVLTDGAQTINGTKTYSSSIPITSTTNQLVLGTTNTVTLTAPAPAASRVYTIPDVGGNASFVMSAGNNTFGGTTTFSSAVNLTATSNQMVLGTGTTTTLNAVDTASSVVYTMPDVGGDASFVMTEGNQTVNGTKTFGDIAVNTAKTLQKFVSYREADVTGGIWTSTTADGVWCLRKDAAAESCVINFHFDNLLSTTANKGYRINSIQVIYTLTTAAATSFTPSLLKYQFVDTGFPSSESSPTSNDLTTATSAANSYHVKSITPNTPTYNNTVGSYYSLDLNLTTPSTTVFSIYGILVNYSLAVY